MPSLPIERRGMATRRVGHRQEGLERSDGHLWPSCVGAGSRSPSLSDRPRPLGALGDGLPFGLRASPWPAHAPGLFPIMERRAFGVVRRDGRNLKSNLKYGELFQLSACSGKMENRLKFLCLNLVIIFCFENLLFLMWSFCRK